MINELNAGLFTGEIKTLREFIHHCQPFIDDNAYSPITIDRAQLIASIHEKRRRAIIKFEQILLLDESPPYADRANGQREVGRAKEIRAQAAVIEKIEFFIEQLTSRTPEYRATYEYEFILDELKKALATAQVPLPELEGPAKFDEEEAKAYLLSKYHDEVLTETEYMQAVIDAPEAELREIVVQYTIRESRLRPYDLVDEIPTIEAPTLS